MVDAVKVPTFLPDPKPGWIICESAKAVPGGDEVACIVTRIDGEKRVVVTSKRFYDAQMTRLSATIIGEVGSGFLVDLPSGERLTMAADSIFYENGGSI